MANSIIPADTKQILHVTLTNINVAAGAHMDVTSRGSVLISAVTINSGGAVHFEPFKYSNGWAIRNLSSSNYSGDITLVWGV